MNERQITCLLKVETMIVTVLYGWECISVVRCLPSVSYDRFNPQDYKQNKTTTATTTKTQKIPPYNLIHRCSQPVIPGLE